MMCPSGQRSSVARQCGFYHELIGETWVLVSPASVSLKKTLRMGKGHSTALFAFEFFFPKCKHRPDRFFGARLNPWTTDFARGAAWKGYRCVETKDLSSSQVVNFLQKMGIWIVLCHRTKFSTKRFPKKRRVFLMTASILWRSENWTEPCQQSAAEIL